MLIEFSVSNFRSFRDKQTLSLVAASRLSKRENVFAPEIIGEKFPSLLKTCVVYGPNASGKSNLLKALSIAGRVANREPTVKNRPFPVAPFRFDKGLWDKPSCFEYNFIFGGNRYQFNLELTQDRIHGERLVLYRKGKEFLLYDRKHTPEGDKYDFGDALIEHAGPLIETWRRITPPQILFIAQAVANSEEKFDILRTPFNWIRKSIYPVIGNLNDAMEASQKLAAKSNYCAMEIARFLQDIDVPVSKITVETVDSDDDSGGETLKVLLDRKPIASMRTTLTHVSALGEAQMMFEEESEGTKNLIGFWLPWASREPLENEDYKARCVLAVDEMDASLHPKIVASLVSKHIKAKVDSQLIFTTHDTHLMDAKILRRDQFWVAERDQNGATQLRSIHDFEGRESEDIEKRYYEGKYRGLPFVREA